MTKGGPPVRVAAEPVIRAAYACGQCGYGITAAKLPHRCPMCGGRRWTPVYPRSYSPAVLGADS